MSDMVSLQFAEVFYQMLKLPAIRCVSTRYADVYQTGLTLHDLVPYLLGGHDPRSQYWKNLPPQIRSMYEKIQRTTKKDRRDRLRRYVLRRMSPDADWIGAFPPIVVGMPVSQVFVPGNEEYSTLGLLRVQSNLKYPNILLDGIGRITVLLDIMDDNSLPEKMREWAGSITVPVMLITGSDKEGILDYERLGQLFHDFNTLGVPVGQGQAIDLDHSDDYIIATNRVGAIDVIEANGGLDTRAVSIGKNAEAWVTKTILLKAVRAAAEGPGGHVDHVRDSIANPWLSSGKQITELTERFETALETFVDGLGDRITEKSTVLRTPAWWIAFGLILNDLYRNYDGNTVSSIKQDTLIKRMAKIDWSLGNPEFSFLGTSVADKKTGSKPIDSQGRELINRFHGGSKAYYNLAAYIRHKIGLKAMVSNYGLDYGASISVADTDLEKAA